MQYQFFYYFSLQLQTNILHGNTNVVHLRRRIGMVFQKPNPFPKSIAENVSYGLKIIGLHDKKKLAEAVENSLRALAQKGWVRQVDGENWALTPAGIAEAQVFGNGQGGF